MRTLAIISGGMDSSTLAFQLAHEGDNLYLLSFDYGQRHKRELLSAADIAKDLKALHEIVDLTHVGSFLGGSALTSKEIEVPEGHYAAESMAQTVVSNRNAIMLAVAFGAAVTLKADRVAFAAHAGDHFVYPDCRPNFVKAFDLMEGIATEGFAAEGLHLFAPYINISKADIVSIGASIGVPYEKTWSCYVGGERHCSVCGTCAERREAFRMAKVPDPTDYELTEEEFDRWWGENAK